MTTNFQQKSPFVNKTLKQQYVGIQKICLFFFIFEEKALQEEHIVYSAFFLPFVLTLRYKFANAYPKPNDI